MPGATRSWFISYAFRPVHRKALGGFQFGEVCDAFAIVAGHPARFIAKLKNDHNAWRAGKLKPNSDRSDEILRLYSAIPLTDSDINPAVLEAFE